MSSFADHLTRIRQDRGWSRKDLAARAGLTPQGIGQLETGRRTIPDILTLCRLKRATGLTLDYLAGPLCALLDPPPESDQPTKTA